METLTAMPARFTAGTTVSYTRSIANLPDSAYGWALYVSLADAAQLVAGPFTVTNASADVVIASTATAALTPGSYRWQETLKELSPGTRVQEVSRGNSVVDFDLSTATAGSGQTDAARTLVALKAAMLGRITADAETIVIDGTTIAHIPFELLDSLVWKYQRIVDLQNNPKAFFGTVQANWGPAPLLTLPGYPLPPMGGV